MPEYFRDLLAMMTDVSESEWGSNKDPSEKMKDSTLKSYVTRGFPVKFATSIVYRLSMDNLKDNIKMRPSENLSLLAKDLQAYDPTTNADNVADKIAQWLTEIVQVSAKMIQKTELEIQKQQVLSTDLKNTYGAYLLKECKGCCTFEGCGKLLSVTVNGNLQNVYDVTLIEKSGKQTVENLLAMCPQCYATYQIDNKTHKHLKNIKKHLYSQFQDENTLNTSEFEKGLTEVIKKIARLNAKDFEDSSLKPLELKEKIDANKNFHLYTDVKHKVVTYYAKVNEIMINLDKRGDINYDELQSQMKSIYNKLRKKTQIEIFHSISEKIRSVTLADDIYIAK